MKKQSRKSHINPSHWTQSHLHNGTTETQFLHYLCGFVDGEGCFSVSFRILPRLTTGIEVRPSFSLGQKKCPENFLVLEKIKGVLGGGGIRDDNNGCYKLETRSLPILLESVIPFFLTYPLRTQKARDFAIFSHICSRMEKKQHLHLDGLRAILEESRPLNPLHTRRNSLDDLIALVDKKKSAQGMIKSTLQCGEPCDRRGKKIRRKGVFYKGGKMHFP